MEPTNEAKLEMLGGVIKKLRAENRRLREELAALRGEKTREQRRIDREDEEVFKIARGEVKGAGGTWVSLQLGVRQ